MKRDRLRAIGSRLGCFVARKVVQHFRCEQIVDVASKLGLTVDYQPHAPFGFTHQSAVISRFVPTGNVIQVFGDQLFRYQEEMSRRNIQVDFLHLVYHAIACEIGHHLWYRFLKEASINLADWDATWLTFENWLADILP